MDKIKYEHLTEHDILNQLYEDNGKLISIKQERTRDESQLLHIVRDMIDSTDTNAHLNREIKNEHILRLLENPSSLSSYGSSGIYYEKAFNTYPPGFAGNPQIKLFKILDRNGIVYIELNPHFNEQKVATICEKFSELMTGSFSEEIRTLIKKQKELTAQIQEQLITITSLDCLRGSCKHSI